MPLAFTGIFRNNLAYSGISWHFRKNNSEDINLVKSSRIHRINCKNITLIMFDAPLTIQHAYVQLGIVSTIKDIQ